MDDFERKLERLSRRLRAIDQRLNRIAKQEETAAWVGGHGANGEYFTEKDRLVRETDMILDHVDALLGISTKTAGKD